MNGQGYLKFWMARIIFGFEQDNLSFQKQLYFVIIDIYNIQEMGKSMQS